MKAIVVFDGVCNLCNGLVRFILKLDRKEIFRFVWMQSDTGQELYKRFSLDFSKENSVILILDEKVYSHSTAVLLILKMLGGFWKLFYALIVIPKFFRDDVYNFIARNRYKWFGRKDECEMPEEKYRTRFLN